MTESGFFSLLALSLLGSVAGILGGVFLFFNEKWSKSLVKVSLPLASGVLLSVSFLDLLPETVESLGDLAFPLLFSVFVGLFLIERLFFHLDHHGDKEDHDHSNKYSLALVVFGDTIHNLLDGVAIGAAFLVNPSLAFVVALSTFLHETPHEIADFGILRSAGWSKKKTFFTNLFSALITVPGAFLTYYFGDKIESLEGVLLGIAAGMFLYVAATDFLPETKHADKKDSVKNVVFFLLGIILILLVRKFVPETH